MAEANDPIEFEKFRSHILEMLVSSELLNVILQEIVLGIEKLHPQMLCSILLLDSEGKHLGNGIAPSLPDFYNEAISGVQIGVGVGSCGTAAYSNERVIVEDITTHPYWAPYKELALRAGLGSCWSQPIRSSTNQVLGTFAIYHHDIHTPNESDIYLIEQSARLASIAIEKSVSETKLRESEALYRLLTEDVSDVIWKTDLNLNVTYISPADERLRGFKADEVIGHSVLEMFTDEGIALVIEKIKEREADEKRGIKTDHTTFEVQHRCKDGTLKWGEILSKPERDTNGTIIGYHGITRDITERKQMQEYVHQLAFYDQLTKLPNRRLFYDRLRQAMASSKRSQKYCVLMFLDLDNFKPLNDTCGHAIGDVLLIQAAERIKNCVREVDTVARFGGDEFVIMVNELSDDKTESIVQAKIVAEKIRSTLSAPYLFNIDNNKTDHLFEYYCSASIGVLLFINHEGNEDQLLDLADKAMYLAKEKGRNTIHFCNGIDSLQIEKH